MRQGPSQAMLLADAEARIEELQKELGHARGAIERVLAEYGVLTDTEVAKIHVMDEALDSMDNECNGIRETIGIRFDKAEMEEQGITSVSASPLEDDGMSLEEWGGMEER